MLTLQGLEQFEQRFFDYEARSLDEAVEWMSRRHAAIKATACKSPSQGSVARFARATIDDVSLVSYRWNVAVEGQFLEDYPALFVGIPLSGQVQMEADDFGRVQSGPDQLRIYRRASGHRNIGSSDYGNLALIIPSDMLERRARSTYQYEQSHPLSFNPVLDMGSSGGQVIVSLVSYLVAQLASVPGSFDNPIVRSTIKEYLVSALLTAWPHKCSHLPFAKDDQYIPVWVKRAENYMRVHCHEPITVENIARNAGCSERTLQYAFKTYRSVSPMRFLRDLRLEEARNDITGDEGTITDIALKWGFNQPARFARFYADRFGKLPSDERKSAYQ